MMHRTFLRIAVLLAVALTVGSGRPRVDLSAHQSPQTQATVPAGQSRTRLADGRVLIVGGEGALGTASVWDPTTQTATPTTGSLIVPRAWHTGTLLSDGTVLIAGGRNGSGTIGTAEIFDPATGLFAQIAMAGAVARAEHTATLLLDGRVLIVGGTDGNRDALPIEIWDLVAQSSTIAGVAGVDREDQRATLASDGTVLLTGGKTLDGRSNVASLVIDPSTGDVSDASTVQSRVVVSKVSASIPLADATDIDTGAHVALRFSVPVAIDSITSDRVTLTGPTGLVNTAIVTAEDGRLVFVWPDGPLADGAAYTVTAAGLTDQLGGPVMSVSFQFTTKPQSSNNANSVDREAWTPDPLDGEHGWLSNRPPSPWESLAPLIAAPGITAVSGRVLKLDGAPLKDVTLAIEGHAVRSDASGRFLLPLAPWTSRLTTLAIDARTANKPNHTYGFYEARIGVYAGKTNVLPFTIWSPLIDTAHQVTIPSPTASDTLVTTPTMPGLELHLPAGTVIQDDDHHLSRTVSLTPIPLDRTPFPLPDNATFSMFFTIQPGGAYLSTPGPIKGGWLVYPNIRHSRTGSRVQFFNYDPDDKGWYPYGMGTITGPSVVPDPKTRIYGFTGASFNDGTPTPPAGPAPGGSRRGDPVDGATGIFTYRTTDLVVPDVMPLVLTRSYNSQDPYSRAFGTGMSHTFGLFEHSQNWPVQADMYLPDGGKVHFDRVSDPSLPVQQTVFVHTTTPTGFYQAHMSFWGDPLNTNSQGWQVALPDGTVYVFPHAGSPLQAIRDRYGNEIRLTWASGLLQRVTSPNGRWIAFTYGTGGLVSQVSDNIGRTVSYVYDTNGNLKTATDPENNVTTYNWDTSNRLVSIEDGRNITWLSNQYDTSNRVAQQTLANPSATYGFAYTTDGSGNITQTAITDPRGHVEQLNFNADHYMTSDVEAVNQPEQRTTTIERQSGSDFPTAVVDGLNRRTEYTYDTGGHVLTVTRLAGTPDAVTAAFTYEPAFFQLATVTDPLSHTWTLGYDTTGRLTSISDPLNHQTTVVMNTQGQVTSVTDPLQHAWQFGYTGGDQTSVTNPVGAVSRRALDAVGRVLSTTDPLGNVARLVPDKLNRVTSITDPLGGQTSFQYDQNSRMLTLTDALNHATGYTYDTSDRTATRTDPLLKSASFAYDLNDNLTETTDRKGQVTGYQYDTLDRLTLVTYDDASTTQYTYDAGNRITQIADSVAGTITRGYDDLDRLTSETTPEGSITYTYDADGRRQTMTVAGQPEVTYDYDDAHRLTSITQGASVVTLTYDGADRRTTLTYPDGIVATYAYDDANQLTGLTYSLGSATLGTLTYTYDLAGNRTSVGGSWARTGLPEPVTGVSYDTANRIQDWAGPVFSYDANGNLASDGLTSYTWNARNQLVGLSGGTSASFAYDGISRRRSKTTSGSTSFLYDGLNAVQELTSGTPTANLLTGSPDEVFERTDSGGTRDLLTDALGSTLGLVDTAGILQTQYGYDPFGGTSASGAPTSNTAQYTGRENDLSNLYYYRARYYSPALERFISEDPIVFADGFNVYPYAHNNPVTLRDPFGLSASSAAWCFAKGAAGGAAGAIVIGGLAVVVAAAGAPVVAVTVGLGAVAVVGTGFTAYNTASNYYQSNWDGVSYDIGSLVGGAVTGGFAGRAIAEGINGVPSPPWSLGSDWAQGYTSDYPGGSVGKWAGSGPNPGSAAGTAALGGAGAASMAARRCGCK